MQLRVVLGDVVAPQEWCRAHPSRAVKGWGNEAAYSSIFSIEALSHIKNIYHSSLLPPVSVQFLALSLSVGGEINYKGNDTAEQIRSYEILPNLSSRGSVFPINCPNSQWIEEESIE